jgi:hypothetical protein
MIEKNMYLNERPSVKNPCHRIHEHAGSQRNWRTKTEVL